MKSTTIKQEAVSLLQRLITIPSFSKQEEGTAAILVEYLKQWGAEPYRVGNNVYAIAKGFNPLQPTLLLISHHDTVKPMHITLETLFLPLLKKENSMD